MECGLEHGSRSILPPKNLRIAFTYFGGVHQSWLSEAALLRPAVMGLVSPFPSVSRGVIVQREHDMGLLKKLFGSSTASSATHADRGEAHLSAGQYEQAIAQFTEA